MARSCYSWAVTVPLASGLGIIGVEAQGLWHLQIYKSSPAKTPFLNVTRLGQTKHGSLFFSPNDTIRGAGQPTIYSDDGQLVWQGLYQTTFAMRPQMFEGEPVVTSSEGTVGFSLGFGQITIIDNTY